MTADLPARPVAVATLSLRTELGHVVRASALVVLGVWLYLAASAGRTDAARRLLPYQWLVTNQPPAEQRMFRELQEGLLEAEQVRSATGVWPAVAALAEAGVPPFAPDPTVKGATYRWTLQRDGLFVNYLGVPDRADRPAWLVLVQEPAPGAAPDQNVEDEEHHRLSGGVMLHVSTWSHVAASRTPSQLVRVPQAEGWNQLYAVGPTPAPSR